MKRTMRITLDVVVEGDSDVESGDASEYADIFNTDNFPDGFLELSGGTGMSVNILSTKVGESSWTSDAEWSEDETSVRAKYPEAHLRSDIYGDFYVHSGEGDPDEFDADDVNTDSSRRLGGSDSLIRSAWADARARIERRVS